VARPQSWFNTDGARDGVLGGMVAGRRRHACAYDNEAAARRKQYYYNL